MHRVFLDGPDWDDPVCKVVMAVCDWPDTDLGERGHAIGSKGIAAHIRRSQWQTRELLARAVREEWLEILKPATRRQGPVYRLGPVFVRARSHRALYAASPHDFALSERETERDGRAHTSRSDGGGPRSQKARSAPYAAAAAKDFSSGTGYTPNWTQQRLNGASDD